MKQPTVYDPVRSFRFGLQFIQCQTWSTTSFILVSIRTNNIGSYCVWCFRHIMPSADDVSVPVQLQQRSAIKSPSLISYFFVVWGSICSQGTPSHLLHVYINKRTNLDRSGGRPQTAISTSAINRIVCLRNNKRSLGTVQQFKFLLTVPIVPTQEAYFYL